VSKLPWNECPSQRGITVQVFVEWVSKCTWNPQTWVTFVNAQLKTKGTAHCVAGFLYADHAIEKGEEKVLLEVHFPKNALKFMEARSLVKSAVELIDTKIDYECYYGNKFTAAKRPNDMTTTPVPSNIQP
ncbi:hypothetical protein, partial [Pseudomonas syringae]